MKFSKKKIGFYLTHLSIVIIILGAIYGNLYGHKGYIQIAENETVSTFVENEKKIPLGFELFLVDFGLDYYEAKDPLKGGLEILDKSGVLTDSIEFDFTSLFKEYQAKNGVTLTALRFVPSFMIDLQSKQVASKSDRPDNPALLVKYEKGGKTSERWLFANFADFHGKGDEDFSLKFFLKGNPTNGGIKSFKSNVNILEKGIKKESALIEVNKPFSYNGITFYQSSYDSENLSWSGLQVVSDPGVSIVYFGFILLILGVIIIFYFQRHEFFKAPIEPEKNKNSKKN